MPDISMCTGTGCPMKMTCYRYRAIPTPMMQSYFVTPPNAGTKCDYHSPLMPGDRLAKDPEAES